jgi:hypothetical protein
MKKKITFNFDSKKLYRVILFSIYVAALIVIISYLVIPVVSFILDLLLTLFVQYLTLEGNFRFFGTFVMLVIVWKIWEVLINLTYQLFVEAVQLVQPFWKKKKKNEN